MKRILNKILFKTSNEYLVCKVARYGSAPHFKIITTKVCTYCGAHKND